MPTEQQINEAKQYVLRRVQAELGAVSVLEDSLLEAAEEIIRIAGKYNIPPAKFRFSANKKLKSEVDEIITWLKSVLSYYAIKYAALSGKADEEKAWGIINRKIKGKTFSQRLDTYANRWQFEFEAFLAAAMAKNLTAAAIENRYGQAFKNPYPFIRGTKGEAVRLSGVSYGTGKSNLSYNMLSGLMRNTVADAWMQADAGTAVAGGAMGFYSYRGSSFPCPYCNSMAGYHPIADFPGIWHPNCKCYFIFVYP